MADNKRDDFSFAPDMTLPEEPPAPPPPPSSPHFPPPGHPGWAVGDWVLAPWEPEFLYAGRIVRFDGGRAHVQFEDGDSGLVETAQLRPLQLPEGQLVLCRREMGRHYAPATVQRFRGDEVTVRFLEDGEVEHTTIAAVRVPAESPGAGAEPLYVANKGFEGSGRLGLNPFALPNYPQRDDRPSAAGGEGMPRWVWLVLLWAGLLLLRTCR
jgi:hypothetical protein